MTGRAPTRLSLRWPTDPRWMQVLVPVIGYVVEVILSGLRGETRFDVVLPGWAVALLLAPAFIVAVWRYQHPWLTITVAALQSAVFAVLIPDSLPIMAALIALHTIARYRPLRQVGLASLLIVPPVAIATLEATEAAAYSLADQVVTLLTVAFVYAAAALVVILLGHSQRVAAELRTTRVQVYDAMVEARVQDDRLRVARTLHDKVANSYAAVSVALDAALRMHPELPEDAKGMMGLAHESAQQAMTETRRIVTLLHGDHDPEPELEDLESTLTRMQADGWRGVDVDVTIIGQSVALSPDVDACITRAVRQSMTNAGTSGIAKVAIEVDWRDDPFTITFRRRPAPGSSTTSPVPGGAGIDNIVLHVAGADGSLSLDTADRVSVLRLAFPRRAHDVR